MTEASFTQDELHNSFDLEPSTGVLTWKVGQRKGKSAGCRNAKGYVYVRFCNVLYLRHRLVWFYIHGQWPSHILDHKDGVPGNDGIHNLRLATNSQNKQNQGVRSDNRSGIKGVYYDRRKRRFYSRIEANNIKRWLGLFKTAEEAADAYAAAAKEMHGEFARYDVSESKPDPRLAKLVRG